MTMNDIAVSAKTAGRHGPYLVHDHSGMAHPWLEHLLWLNNFIPEVDVMRASEAWATLPKRWHAS